MEMTILLALIATTATVIGAVYAFLRNFKVDLNGHISRLEKDINNLAVRTDQIAGRMDQRMDQHAARMDQLYQIMIDLLKDRKKTDP
jgi:hypothetical protein